MLVFIDSLPSVLRSSVTLAPACGKIGAQATGQTPRPCRARLLSCMAARCGSLTKVPGTTC